MADTATIIRLPIEPSTDHQRFSSTIDGATYVFEARWNVVDESWYLDVYEADGATAIVYGLRVVLGAYLGRTTPHKLFRDGALIATDAAHRHQEAAFDDIDRRVILQWIPADEIMSRISFSQAQNRTPPT
jgi:hypothetical protein